jgi:hypothetical protein
VITSLAGHHYAPLAAVIGAAFLAGMATRRRRHADAERTAGISRRVQALLFGTGVGGSLAVAVVAGIRSFHAVSSRFGGWAVPATADGTVIACTALRLYALTRGERLPGSLAVSYVFIAGTVALNVDAATAGFDQIAHGLAPLSYAVLVEMLAYLIRRHLDRAEEGEEGEKRHTQPKPTPRLAALAWLASPVTTTRVWVHLARAGTADLSGARRHVQQTTRLRSRLRVVCPGRSVAARAARRAALATVRDLVLAPADLARQLPGGTLPAAELLLLVDQAALRAPGEPLEQAAERPAVPDNNSVLSGPPPTRPHPAPDVSGVPCTGTPEQLRVYTDLWLPALGRCQPGEWPYPVLADLVRDMAEFGIVRDRTTVKGWAQRWQEHHAARPVSRTA